MTDEEFLEKYPISEYHGVCNDKGRVGALLFNRNVSDKIYAVDEWGLHNAVLKCRDHKRICPQDIRNTRELEVSDLALREVQAEKRRLNIPLERPPLDERPNLAVVSGDLSLEP